MIRKTRLFTPGPTPLLPAAQFAMAAADIHHRTPEFHALYTRVLSQLKDFIGTKNDVIILSAPRTGAMKAAVSNLPSPGDRALALAMGRWGLHVLIRGSQKADMMPPGLSYLAVSPRAWDRMESTYNPRYYFDLRKERKNAAKGESAYTPAVALIAGLGGALDKTLGRASAIGARARQAV